MKKQLYVIVALIMAATMILTACGPAATDCRPATQAPAPRPRLPLRDGCPRPDCDHGSCHGSPSGSWLTPAPQ